MAGSSLPEAVLVDTLAAQRLRDAIALTQAAGSARVRIAVIGSDARETDAWIGICDFVARRVHVHSAPDSPGSPDEFVVVNGAEYMGFPGQSGDARWVAVKPGSVPLDPIQHLDRLASADDVRSLSCAGMLPQLAVTMPCAKWAIRLRSPKRSDAHLTLDDGGRISKVRYRSRRARAARGVVVEFGDFGVEVPEIDAPQRASGMWTALRSALR
jgi:hypothetical protein